MIFQLHHQPVCPLCSEGGEAVGVELLPTTEWGATQCHQPFEENSVIQVRLAQVVEHGSGTFRAPATRLQTDQLALMPAACLGAGITQIQ